MLETLLTAAAIGALAGALAAVMDSVGELVTRWGRQRRLKSLEEVQFTGTDQEMIETTQKLLHEHFGENPVETIGNASNLERVQMITDFAKTLAQEYGLDIDVDIVLREAHTCGFYNRETKQAKFNVMWIMPEASTEHYDEMVWQMLDTIIHELRHAVQCKAIEEPGFWGISEETREAWANNLKPGNYISPLVDFRAYARQPIEWDAEAFAMAALKGVKNNEQ